MKSVSSSIQALQGELAANTAAFSRAQKQAAGAAEAVGALEQQVGALTERSVAAGWHGSFQPPVAATCGVVGTMCSVVGGT
jgi:hypothetical protein